MIVHICNNDEYGNFTKKVRAIQFESEGEIAIRLEPIFIEPVEATIFNDRIIEIYGAVLKHGIVQFYTGNVMWNTFEFSDEYALGLLRVLQLSNEWTVEEAWTGLYDKFKDQVEITGIDFGLRENIQPRIVNRMQLELKLK